MLSSGQANLSRTVGLTHDAHSREQLLWMYEHMTLIREFEERLKWLVETGVPVGAVHYYTGQEACAECAAQQGCQSGVLHGGILSS